MSFLKLISFWIILFFVYAELIDKFPLLVFFKDKLFTLEIVLTLLNSSGGLFVFAIELIKAEFG